MTLRYLLLFWLFVQNVGVTAQTPVQDYGNLITPEDLKENLSIIASDALEGRETGTRGQKMAAAFIRHHFETLGLEAPVNGSYFQHFTLHKTFPGEVYVMAGTTRFKNFEDIVYYGKDNSGGEVSLPVVFAGRGRAEDYQQLDVAGKAVLVMLGEEDDYRVAASLARSKNAQMVFVLNTETPEEFKGFAKQFESFLSDGRLSLKKPSVANKSAGIFFVATAVAEKILNSTVAKLSAATSSGTRNNLKKIAQGRVTYKTSVEIKNVETENVLGYLEGTDKKDEVVVITSHYDHIGKKGKGTGDLINNGADDDGSGTVAVLQLAKAFVQAKKDGKGPRRSILFMTVAGEENGLLGSEYYTENPVFPLSKTVVDLNIDMIGRRDEQHKESPPYVYVIGADKLSSALNTVSESMNSKYTNLVFDYTYNDEDHPARLYYRSDHWNFAEKNIPIIFYFDGIHEDYHLPSDE
ncbi:MAG TPA: M28 family peptidase, partial [Chryseosolibacter sp.]|nr:M28 family peptidase [Chryseosolibacter sp.]